jgi:hypothetical protein
MSFTEGDHKTTKGGAGPLGTVPSTGREKGERT